MYIAVAVIAIVLLVKAVLREGRGYSKDRGVRHNSFSEVNLEGVGKGTLAEVAELLTAEM